MVMRPLSSMGRNELLAELELRRARDAEQTAQYDAVTELIENPPAPTPALVQLMQEAREKNPDGFRSREDILAELVKRRRQPVIPTCGDCASCVSFYEGASALLPSAHCVYARERDVPLAQSPCPVVDAKAPPPDWCPWRGAV